MSRWLYWNVLGRRRRYTPATLKQITKIEIKTWNAAKIQMLVDAVTIIVDAVVVVIVAVVAVVALLLIP